MMRKQDEIETTRDSIFNRRKLTSEELFGRSRPSAADIFPSQPAAAAPEPKKTSGPLMKSDPLFQYKSDKPVRQAGSVVANTMAKSFEEAIDSVGGDNIATNLFTRLLFASARGVTAVATSAGESLGILDEGEAAFYRGTMAGLRTQDRQQPTFIETTLESLAESSPAMVAGLGGSGVGTALLPGIGTIAGGAAGGGLAAAGLSYQNAKLENELFFDREISRLEAIGDRIPIEFTDAAIEESAKFQATVEGVTTAVFSGLTFGLGAVGGPLLGKLLAKKLAKSIVQKAGSKVIKSATGRQIAKGGTLLAAGQVLEGVEEGTIEAIQAPARLDPQAQDADVVRAALQGFIGGTIQSGSFQLAGRIGAQQRRKRMDARAEREMGEFAKTFAPELERVRKNQDRYEGMSNTAVREDIESFRAEVEQAREERRRIREGIQDGRISDRRRAELNSELEALSTQEVSMEAELEAREAAAGMNKDGMSIRRVRVLTPKKRSINRRWTSTSCQRATPQPIALPSV